MTFFILQYAAARARTVAACLCGHSRPALLRHHLSRRAPLLQERRHLPHGLIDVRKERPIARAEVVEPRFTRWCLHKTVLGTFPMARKADRTLMTVPRERVALVQPELTLRV